MTPTRSRENSYVTSVFLIVLLMLSAGCGGDKAQLSVQPTVTDMFVAEGDGISFTVESLSANIAASLDLSLEEQQGQVVVHVCSAAAHQLDELLFELSFDPAQYTPLAVQATGAITPLAKSLCFDMLNVPGTLSFAQVPLDGTGAYVDGGVVLAEVLFSREPHSPADTRSVSAVPTHKNALSPLVWDGDTGELRWYYTNPGDNNQDSLVSINDISPLAWAFGSSGPFSFFTLLSVIDSDGDGLIHIADISAIGQYWGNRIEGYNLYASEDISAVPTGYGEPSTITPLASFGMEEAQGDPLVDRLWFSYVPKAWQENLYYWVRPYADGLEGTRSNVNSPLMDSPPPIFPEGSGFNLAPKARLGLEHTGSNVPLMVTFDATQSSDTDGEIVFYEWDFEGDGLFDSFSTGAVALHTYLREGTYAPLVRVTDDGGLWDSFQSPPFTLTEEEVTNIAPMADLIATTTSGEAPLTVGFIATGSTDIDGYIVQYEWDFDSNGSWNLNSGSDSTVLQCYDEPGIFEATVRVTDNRGDTDSSAVTIEITARNQPPTAILEIGEGEASGNVPHTVHFDASGSSDPDNNIAKYWWDLDGDGDYELTTFNPACTHTYVDPGTFRAVVMVEDSHGDRDGAYRTINVQPPRPNQLPVAALWAYVVGESTPLTLKLYASASYDPDGSIVNYEWDFNGDGTYDSFGSQDNATHIYPFQDEFTAYVRVTDDDGAQDITSFEFPAAPNDWSMFGHDLRHTRCSPFVGAQTNNVAWTYGTDGTVYSSPAIGTDGTVYVGSYDGMIHAINPDGTPKDGNWPYATGGHILTSSPAIGADGTVYVGSNNKLYAINPDGTFKWSYNTGWISHSSPVIGTDGTVYVGSRTNKLHAINADGSFKWSYTTGGDVDSSPAIGADGTAYVGSNDKKLYAINPDGTFKWSYATGDAVESSPAIGADGTVYVGSWDGMLHAVNPDGSLKWSYNTGWISHSSPAIGTDGTVYVGSRTSKLHAINADGSLKWSCNTGGDVNFSPAIGADGTVYVGSWFYSYSDGSMKGRFCAITHGGHLKWSYITGYEEFSNPAIGADGIVYVGCSDRKLYAFGP